MTISCKQMIGELKKYNIKGLSKMNKDEIFSLYKKKGNTSIYEENIYKFESSSISKIKSILNLHEKIYSVNILCKVGRNYNFDKNYLLKIVKKHNVKFIDLDDPDTFTDFMIGGYDSIK